MLKFVSDELNGLHRYVSDQCANAGMYKSLYLEKVASERQDKIECVTLK